MMICGLCGGFQRMDTANRFDHEREQWNVLNIPGIGLNTNYQSFVPLRQGFVVSGTFFVYVHDDKLDSFEMVGVSARESILF
ncbi:MAG: hypothetical protein ACRCUY_11250 [Thermoguttaceae bacterium]